MKASIPIVVMLLLASCGGSIEVDLHIVSKQEVLEIACQYEDDPRLAHYAYTVWDDLEGKCDIYILPMDQMTGDEKQWQWERLLGHELRHCFEGDFHE